MSDEPEIDNRSTPPVQCRPWTRQDYLLTSIAVMIKLGDGVEIYLPGVITQKVSCELGVSELQENVLAVILFLCYTVAIMTSVPISNRFGEKFTLFLSLYLSILFAVLCAVVPNYYTLLISRALTGFCAGLNGCTVGIYLAKHASSKEVLTKGSFLSCGFAIPAGGAWVSILGWLLLEVVGWRIFVLLTSIPLFVPPIALLHFCISEKQEDQRQDSTREENSEIDTNSENDELIKNKTIAVPNFTARVIKSSLFFFCSISIGFGSIILLPWLIRSYKIDANTGQYVNKCANVVHGNDLLILAAVTGVANIIGRPIGYFLWNRVRFLVLQSTVTATMALCYALILATDSLIATGILLAAAKFCYALQAVEVAILHYDYGYFGTSGLQLGSSITSSVGMLGSVFGTSLAAFLPPKIAVLITLVLACVELMVIFVMKERF